MNRRGPGRKCCCRTGLFTLDIRFTLHTDGRGGHGLFTRVFFLSRIIEFANWFIFTRRIAESHGLIVPNYRIGLFSHGASRMVTVLLSRDLSFGPTDQREVICELSNFSSHGESRRVSGFMSRIIELSNFFSHGESRRVSGFMSRIIELSNLFSHGRLRRFSLSQDMFLVTNLRDLSLDPLTNGK